MSLDEVEQQLSALELQYRRVAPELIEVPFSGAHRPWLIHILEQALSPHPWLAFSASLQDVPTPRLPEVLRLANLINSERLPWGAFWVRRQDQRLCFEASQPCPVSQEQVGAVGYIPVVLDHFYPAFMRVIWGGQRAEEALAEPGPKDEAEDNGGLDIAV